MAGDLNNTGKKYYCLIRIEYSIEISIKKNRS